LKFGTLMASIPIDASIILLLPKPPEEPGRITIFHPPGYSSTRDRGLYYPRSNALARNAILAGSLWFVLGALGYMAQWTSTTDTGTMFI
jgi:hypothetical protein